MRKRSSRFVLFVVSSALALAISSPAQASTSKARVFTFQNPDGSFVEEGDVVGKATLKRSKAGVHLDLHTTDLGPGHAYTIWWIIFNNPKACQELGCGLDEQGSDFVNPEVDASIMNATGRVADGDGNGWFSAFLPAGFIHTNPSSGNLRQVSGPGLQNVHGAEIHVVVRCHGPWVGPFADTEQLSTLLGDCHAETATELGGCFDAQVAAFPLPRRRNDDDSDSDSDSD